MATSSPVTTNEEGALNSKISTSFQNGIVKEVLKSQFTNPKNKITDDAVELISELLKTLVTETTIRACKQASIQNKTIVTLDDIESVLPQLMLDFP